MQMTRTLAPSSLLRPTWPDVLFGLLIILNAVRTLRHAMWRDELQAFMIAAESSNLSELFQYLKYEQHPGLWHVLLFGVTRFTAAPVSMQLLHMGIAVGVWLLIYKYSPFSTIEKFILILSYFLFWEYFVISRNYALAALLGFGFVALRTSRSDSEFITWILLALLANTVVYGTIWSMALAAVFVIQQGRLSARFLSGIGIYLLGTSIAVATMMVPLSDHGFYYGASGSLLQTFYQKLVHFDPFAIRSVTAGAILPIQPTWLLDWLTFFADPSSAQPPRFLNPNFARGELDIWIGGIDTDHPLRLAIFLVFPIALCWLVVRRPIYVAEFFLTYFGVLLFTVLFGYGGYARHHGILFLALVACVWRTRRDIPALAKRLFLWYAILILSAISGIATLSSELSTFSNARNAVAWLKRNNLDDQLIVANDVALAMAGYLGRPIYQLECECERTFIDNLLENRTDVRSISDLIDRVERAMAKSPGRQVILILVSDREVTREFRTADPDLMGSRIRFTLAEVLGGAVSGEDFDIYRVTGGR
jgi:hypothetical protein